MAFGILVPQPGVKPAPPAVEAQSVNTWAIREVTFIYLSFGCGVQDLPQPGIKLVLPALGAWSLNQWTSREVLNFPLFIYRSFNTPSASVDLLKRIFFFFLTRFGLSGLF